MKRRNFLQILGITAVSPQLGQAKVCPEDITSHEYKDDHFYDPKGKQFIVTHSNPIIIFGERNR